MRAYRWSNHCREKLAPPVTTGPDPSFLVTVERDSSADRPTVIIIGTNESQIDNFCEMLDWYSPASEQEVMDLAQDLDVHIEKSRKIQHYDDLLTRLEKNHIDFESGKLLFRGKPADLDQLGVITAELSESNGALSIVLNGEVRWHWDDYWGCGAWRLL